MYFDLNAPKHGGDLQKWSRQTSGEADAWLDLSSACNREPWPIPEISSNDWYELPDQASLYTAATDYFGIRPIAIGSGSQQFIEALPVLIAANATFDDNSQRTIKVPKVGYREHAFAWEKWGFNVEAYSRFEELLSSQWFAAVVINPNNPTGEQVSSSSFSKLLSLLNERREEGVDCHLIVDEAFMDATPENSLLVTHRDSILSNYVWLMRSVGKFFGIPGARVGFLFGMQAYERSINNLIGPWPVATPSLHITALALQDRQWQATAREHLKYRHSYFWEKVRPKLNTIFDSVTVTSNALFYTWTLEDLQTVEKAFDWLHSVGVHVRVGEGWIRVALPAMSEMEQLDHSLIRLIRGEGGKDLL